MNRLLRPLARTIFVLSLTAVALVAVYPQGFLCVGQWSQATAGRHEALAVPLRSVATSAFHVAALRGLWEGHLEMANRTMYQARAVTEGGTTRYEAEPNAEGPQWVARALTTMAPLAADDTTVAVALGNVLYTDFYGVQDTTKAVAWWQHAAERGSMQGRIRLAVHALQHGHEAQGVEDLRALAEAGHGQAAYLLAFHYHQTGTSEDEVRQWLRTAVDLGYPEAAQVLQDLDASR